MNLLLFNLQELVLNSDETLKKLINKIIWVLKCQKTNFFEIFHELFMKYFILIRIKNIKLQKEIHTDTCSLELKMFNVILNVF